jgi:GH3 auxin-responsive promoter
MMAAFANSAWLAACLPEYRRLRAAMGGIRQEQERVLLGIVRANAETEFGRGHSFASIHSMEEYRRRVPLSEYEDYRALVDRIAAGERHVLTSEPVRLFEPTSGSSAAAKWIPYTHSLLQEFQRGIRAWVADLFLHHPDLLRGPAYWSVSPVQGSPRVTPGGIPVGFADDVEYVGGLQQGLVRAAMAVPASVRHLQSIEEFRLATLRHLVRRPDLRFISVWNPSFLTLLVEQLPLLEDDPAVTSALRAATPGERHVRLWPRLRIISCWADANSAPAARKLAALFPQAQIQPKGLISTEGFVSFPWEACGGAAVLAVRSHFLEFLPVNSESEPLLADELELHQDYSVVLTTSGGLYRYQTGDIVTVTGRQRDCPLVRFAGRKQVVDFCGEKLHELHVSRAIGAAFSRHGIAPSFAMLAPDTNSDAPAYVLYVESDADDDRLCSIASCIEQDLQENYHYRYARRLGQLGPVRLFVARNAERCYLNACIALGQRAGDIKPVALHPRGGWTGRFEGRFIHARAAAGGVQ